MAEQQETDRLAELRLRVFRVFGHGGVKRVAEGIGKNRVFVGNILRGYGTAAPTLDAIEKYLDEHENAEAA